jgi:tetratricopeptide (TPR) repeat protein
MAAHEAARVCALADTDQILISDVVRLVAGSRLDEHEVTAHGTHELKGIAAPVTVWAIQWLPTAKNELKLPSRLDAARSGSFVGRNGEFDQLVGAWKAVSSDGERRVVLLSGEPGIGKTTLSANFAAEVSELGGVVVYGRCDEDLRIPYQPWIEALGQLVDLLPEELLRAHVDDRGAHLARLVPQLAARLDVDVPSGGDGDTERFVLFGCVTDLLARASTVDPILVVVDDLHWADRATVQLLRHVATADVAIRVMLVGTFRDSDVTSDHPLTEIFASLHRESGTARIALRGLGDDDLLVLLETIAGHEMDEQGIALRNALLAETAGNPFFVGEILRHLSESGAIYQREDGRWVAETDLRAVGLPVSVREVVGRRLATLGSDTERILGLAAVIGRDFDIGLLAAIAKVDEDTVIDICDAAVTAAVLATTDRADRYTFAHALIEHTLYDGLSPARRARAHSAIAESLETALGDNPGDRTAELAYHWGAAVQPTDTSKAVHYAQLAGDRALAQLAPDEAVRWYTQALELLDRSAKVDDRQRAELLVGLGTAQRQSGIAAYRETLLEAARFADVADDIDLQIRAVLANNRGIQSVVGGVDTERITAIDRALERVGSAPTGARAQLLALAASERTYLVNLPERLRLADEAVDVARSSGDRAALVWALQTPSGSILHPSTLTLRTARTNEAILLADQIGDAGRPLWLSWSLGEAMERADGAALDIQMRRFEDSVARIPHATLRWSLLFTQAMVAGIHGDLAEYERLAEAALVVGTDNGEPDAFTIYGTQLANIRLHQGRMHELIPAIEETLAVTPKLHAYRAALALAHVQGGSLDQAKAILDADFADDFPMPADSQWSTGIGCWVDTAVRVRAVDAAPKLREMILPYHDQIVTTGTLFQFAFCHYLGLLEHVVGNYDDAEEWFTEALELHERVRSPILVAYTHAAWAEMLADRNQGDDHARARTMARAALDAAVAGGYGYIETDASAVLDRLA